MAPQSLPAMHYYRLVLHKEPKLQISFTLPYLLDLLLVFSGASYGKRQECFLLCQELSWRRKNSCGP